ncbi:MAG TPA: glycosyltransferase [Bacteroidia bacterium]|nr:glycosyltransferase [Bacteroidia bacterium]
MSKTRIVLIGPMPPPNGGVSTHLSRLLKRSQSEKDLQLSVIDLRRFRVHRTSDSSQNPFTLIRTFLLADVFHFHLSRNLKLWLIKIARSFGKKIIYTHHNSRNLKDPVTLMTMRISHQVILVRPLQDALPEDIQNRIHVIPAYLPSSTKSTIPSELKERIGDRKIIFAHCYQKKGETLLVDGKDLYGFDIILDAFEIMHRDKFPPGYILILADPADGMKEMYKERIDELVKNYNMSVIYWNKELDFSAALDHCALVIRATRSDGDAVSIREALQAGVPVIASNCVERPHGVISFVSGDSFSLSSALAKHFESPGNRIFSQTDYAPQIFRIYRSLSNTVEK